MSLNICTPNAAQWMKKCRKTYTPNAAQWMKKCLNTKMVQSN